MIDSTFGDEDRLAVLPDVNPGSSKGDNPVSATLPADVQALIVRYNVLGCRKGG